MSSTKPIPTADTCGAQTQPDQRGSARLDVDMPAWVMAAAAGGLEPLCCQADNISEGGLHLRATEAAALPLGARVEVRLEPAGTEHSFAHLADVPLFATVIRTERSAAGPPDPVGVGLRFDRPLLL